MTKGGGSTAVAMHTAGRDPPPDGGTQASIDTPVRVQGVEERRKHNRPHKRKEQARSKGEGGDMPGNKPETIVATDDNTNFPPLPQAQDGKNKQDNHSKSKELENKAADIKHKAESMAEAWVKAKPAEEAAAAGQPPPPFAASPATAREELRKLLDLLDEEEKKNPRKTVILVQANNKSKWQVEPIEAVQSIALDKYAEERNKESNNGFIYVKVKHVTAARVEVTATEKGMQDAIAFAESLGLEQQGATKNVEKKGDQDLVVTARVIEHSCGSVELLAATVAQHIADEANSNAIVDGSNAKTGEVTIRITVNKESKLGSLIDNRQLPKKTPKVIGHDASKGKIEYQIDQVSNSAINKKHFEMTAPSYFKALRAAIDAKATATMATAAIVNAKDLNSDIGSVEAATLAEQTVAKIEEAGEMVRNQLMNATHKEKEMLSAKVATMQTALARLQGAREGKSVGVVTDDRGNPISFELSLLPMTALKKPLVELSCYEWPAVEEECRRLRDEHEKARVQALKRPAAPTTNAKGRRTQESTSSNSESGDDSSASDEEQQRAEGDVPMRAGAPLKAVRHGNAKGGAANAGNTPAVSLRA